MGLYEAECPACGGKHEVSATSEEYRLSRLQDGKLLRVHPIQDIGEHSIDGCIASLREQVDELRLLVNRISVLGF